MILALDIGNSQIFGGVFDAQGDLLFNFRKSSKSSTSSDEIGVFLKNVLRENLFDPADIKKIAFCSVVPDLNHSLASCCLKYFNLNPFILRSGVKTGLKIKYRNPIEVGADRIANSIAATKMFPGKNLVVIDFGTATTFCVISAAKEYLGGLIMPGLRLMMESLEENTSKLPKVSITKSTSPVGRSTVECIQSGIYLNTLYTAKEVTNSISKEFFNGETVTVLGTGGFARLFEDEGVFEEFIPELVLKGLYYSLEMNT
ncbi:type III pantothenate kinase [bacterium]|nr:type III pantothenate kinase [bacterium]